MESSALVYVFLTGITIALGLFVDNKDYVRGKIGASPGRNGGRLENGEGVGCDIQQARNRVAICAIYLLLTGVSACRIAVGNDYWVYTQNFSLIRQQRVVSSEIGFNSIVRLFQWIFDEGKVQYVSIFAFFSILTVFFFVKALSDQGSFFAFSLFLLLTGGYYFNSLNSVRYYFALALALYSMKYVLKGEYDKFVLITLLGALIHKTILLIIPVYLLAKFLAVKRLKKWQYIVSGAFLVSLVFCQDIYREILFLFYPFYRDSAFDNGRISWVNLVKCVCVVMLGLITYKDNLKENVTNRFYYFLNVIGLVVYCCGAFIPETSRIGYYMIISQVFLLPRMVKGIRRTWLRRLSYVGVVAGFGAYFVLLLRGMYATDIRLLPYLNWIFN